MVTTLGLIVGVLVAVASPALSATPVWKVASSPKGPVGKSLHLEGVTCPATNSCFAVGWYEVTPPDPNSPLRNNAAVVEHWNGHAWATVTDPGLASAAQLNAVACPSTSSCFAVGGDNGGRALVEHWNGSTWTATTVPNPLTSDGTPVFGTLYGVTCQQPRSCIAVGGSLPLSVPAQLGYTDQPLVEQWNGTTWSVVASSDPTQPVGNQYGQSQLNGIACAVANSCFAVGWYSMNPGISQTVCPHQCSFVEHWNGSTWSLVPIPVPKATRSNPADLNALQGIACPTSNSCFAVGSLGDLNGLVEHWNGHLWSDTVIPNAALPSGVACPSPKSCFATLGALYFKPSMEHWNGSSWSLITLPQPGAAKAVELLGVACRTATSCTVVGGYLTQLKDASRPFTPIIERYA